MASKTMIEHHKRSKEILRKYNEGEFLNKYDCVYMALFATNHPNAESLFYNWDEKIIVKRHMTYPNNCFYFVKKDGTFIDFSIDRCRDGFYPDPITQFNEAARNVISNLMKQLKVDYVNKNGGNILDYHVHHDEITFKKIVDDFIDIRKINIKKVKFISSPRRFKDLSLREDFLNYHNEVAKLVVMTKEEHMSLSKMEEK